MRVHINRPVEVVFKFLSNFENNPRWQSISVEDRKISKGPVGLGITYEAITTMLGRRINSEQTIIVYVPNQLVSRKSTSGTFPFEVHLKFEPIEGGTELNAMIDGEPHGFFKLAEPLLERAIKRQFDSDLVNLKDMMEAGAI
jgi:uncharacterized membrane protein